MEPVSPTSEHWCVAFSDWNELQAAASRHLARGLAQHEQLGIFGWGDLEQLRAPLAALGDVESLIQDRAALVASLEGPFRRDAPPEPLELIGFWADATEAAIAAGFSGLRAIADTTPWAQLHHEQRAVFLHGEQLVNRYRKDHPFMLVCACDASVLPVEALAETASVHPATDGIAPPFRLYATGAMSLAAEGETDAFGSPRLARMLDFVPPVEAGGELTIDATQLDYIDHRSLLALERFARQRGLRAVLLHGASASTVKVVELLRLPRVRAEAVR